MYVRLISQIPSRVKSTAFPKIKRYTENVPLQIVEKPIIIKPHTVKYIANTAENTFRADKELIFS